MSLQLGWFPISGPQTKGWWMSSWWISTKNKIVN